MQEAYQNKGPEIPETNRFRILSRAILANQQRQQQIVESAFAKDPLIRLNSIIRDPFKGRGGKDLKTLLKPGEAKPRIILLASGFVNPFTDWVQMSQWIERKGMEALRLITKTRSQCVEVLDGTVQGDTVEGYAIKTIQETQKKFFDGSECDVVVVRNASKQDLQDAVQYGGKNAVVIVGGHGTLGSLAMTGGSIKNEEIPTPEEPIRAFIQHTCARRTRRTKEAMGDRWSQETYGWERGTSPIDFIDNPFNPRKTTSK